MKTPRRLTAPQLRRLAQAVLDIYRPMPPGELPAHLISVFRSVFPDVVTGYNSFDRRNGTVAVTLDPHAVDYTPLLPAFQQHMLENPLIPIFFDRGPALAATRITDVLPAKEFWTTTLYNEFYRKIDMDFQMGCGVGTQKEPFIAIALNRQGRDFSDDEIFLLNILRPHVRQALEIAGALESANQSMFSLLERSQRAGHHILCFSGEFRVTHVSKNAEKIALSLWNCHPAVPHPLPGPLKDIVLTLRGAGQPELPGAREPITIRQADGWSTRVRLADDPENLRHCLIFEQERLFTQPAQLLPLGLSARENEVAFWILQLKSSWEIGRRLQLSSRIVEKHTEDIFRKLQVRTREGLAEKARRFCNI